MKITACIVPKGSVKKFFEESGKERAKIRYAFTLEGIVKMSF